MRGYEDIFDEIKRLVGMADGLRARYSKDIEREKNSIIYENDNGEKIIFTALSNGANYNQEEESTMPPKYADGSFRECGLGLEYRFMLFDKELNRNRQRTVHGKTDKDCWNKRTALIHAPPKENKTNDITLGEWLDKWYITYKTRKDGSKINPEQENYIRREIKPKLGKITLRKLDGIKIQEFLKTFDDRPNTRGKIYTLLNQSINIALKLNKIKLNPMDAVKIEKHTSISYPVLQLAEQRSILREIKTNRHRKLFMLCCCTGARISEMIHALPHIDFENHLINIVDEDTATKKHKRQIPFLDGLISPNDRDELLNLTVHGAQTYFKRLYEKLEIKAVVHSFRVTFISCCNYVGINAKQIQTWCGHQNIKTTMDTYAKLLTKDGTSEIIDYLQRLKDVSNQV